MAKSKKKSPAKRKPAAKKKPAGARKATVPAKAKPAAKRAPAKAGKARPAAKAAKRSVVKKAVARKPAAAKAKPAAPKAPAKVKAAAKAAAKPVARQPRPPATANRPTPKAATVPATPRDATPRRDVPMAAPAAGAPPAPQRPTADRPAGVDPGLLQDLIGWARAAGADAADAIVVAGTSLSVAQRLGVREKLERSEGRDLGLRVLVGTRQAIVSSTDFAPAGLRELAGRAVAMARAVPEDPVCGLAPEELLARERPELDLDDGREPTPETLMGWCAEAEDAARAVAGVTNSEGAEAGWGRTAVAMAMSNGFTGGYSRAGYSLSCAVLAGDGTAMERDYDWTTGVHVEELEAPAEIGRKAGEGAVKRLNPGRMASGRAPVVFDRRVSGGMLGHLAGAINGRAIARGASFLLDALGNDVFSAGVTIVDDPHRRRGSASKPFDAEGLPTTRRAVVDKGRLTTWILDLAAARQLKMAPTGHASRGVSGPPSPSTTNLHMEPGRDSVAGLIGDVADGLYVTELIGFGVNGVTGDYSRGAAGFRIQSGRLTTPVSGITIAGNLKDMFRNLVPADDLRFKGAVNAPTIRVDGMTIAGA